METSVLLGIQTWFKISLFWFHFITFSCTFTITQKNYSFYKKQFCVLVSNIIFHIIKLSMQGWMCKSTRTGVSFNTVFDPHLRGNKIGSIAGCHEQAVFRS